MCFSFCDFFSYFSFFVILVIFKIFFLWNLIVNLGICSNVFKTLFYLRVMLTYHWQYFQTQNEIESRHILKVVLDTPLSGGIVCPFKDYNPVFSYIIRIWRLSVSCKGINIFIQEIVDKGDCYKLLKCF